jgi:hypothetical protein
VENFGLLLLWSQFSQHSNQTTNEMTKSTIILSSLLLGATAMAGGTSYGKGGKATVAPAPPAEPCPCHLQYTYLEAGWIRLDPDGGADASNGGYVDAYYQVAPNFFIDGSATFLDSPEDSTGLGIGGGGYLPIFDCVHLIGRAGYTYYDADGFDENIWYLSPGIRAQLGCNLEVWSKIYFNIGEEDEKWSYGAGITYHMCPKSAINVGASTGEDGWALQAGLRYKF